MKFYVQALSEQTLQNTATYLVSPLPKQNLSFTKLIRLYLHVYKIPQVRGVPKCLINLPTKF